MVLMNALVMCAAGCTPVAPVGSTGGGSGDVPSGPVDSLLVVPHRSLYAVNDVLARQNDFSVFVHYANNTIAKVPSGDVDIGIIEDIGIPDMVTPVPLEDNPIFLSDGTKGVVVTYGSKSAQYTVQVIDPSGIGGGSGGSGGNGPGITITW